MAWRLKARGNKYDTQEVGKRTIQRNVEYVERLDFNIKDLNLDLNLDLRLDTSRMKLQHWKHLKPSVS